MAAIAVAYVAGAASASALERVLPGDTPRHALASFGGQLVLDGLLAGVAIGVALARGSRLRDVGWRAPNRAWMLAAFPIAAATMLGSAALLVISTRVAGSSGANAQCGTLNGRYASLLVLLVIATVVLAPLAEETAFRGVLFGGLRTRLGSTSATGISAVIFGAAHLQPLLILPLVATGVVLATVYDRSGSLVPGAFVHALLNCAAVALLIAGYCG